MLVSCQTTVGGVSPPRLRTGRRPLGMSAGRRHLHARRVLSPELSGLSLYFVIISSPNLGRNPSALRGKLMRRRRVRYATNSSDSTLARFLKIFDHGLGAGSNMELFVDFAQMAANSLIADAELVGNFLADIPLGQKGQDFLLTSRQ